MFSVQNVQSNSALKRRDLHPQTDWKRVFWHEFLISPPWAKFVLTWTGHQFCDLQFILKKIKEEICFFNSVLNIILYWQITCNNLDVIKLPLTGISWVLLLAGFSGVDLISFSIKLSFSNSRRERYPHWSTLQLEEWYWIFRTNWECIFILALPLLIFLGFRKYGRLPLDLCNTEPCSMI